MTNWNSFYIITVLITVFLSNNLVSGFRQLTSGSIRLSTKLFNKVKVRLLVDVKGQGRKGEIITVSPALWTNVLQPSKQGEKLTDDQIAKEIKEKSESDAKLLVFCNSVSEKVEQLKDDKKLTITKKSGGTGQLFGTITKKNVIEILLKLSIGVEKIEEKSVSISSIKLVEGPEKKEDLDEIRKVGLYKMLVQLHPKVIASFELEVKPEK